MTETQFRKLNPDDLILITEYPTDGYISNWNNEGAMDKYDGMIVKKERFSGNNATTAYMDGWVFMFEQLSIMYSADNYNSMCFKDF